jgi:hypothetical protein
LAGALKSVDGCKVVTAPMKGTGDNGMTMAIVELSGKATLGKVCTALEGAKTPHAEKVAPGVVGAVPLKLKAGTTGEQFVDALRKAGLIDE